MPRIQLQVNGMPVDDWLADTSSEFPAAEFKLLASQPIDEHLLEIVEVTTPDGDVLVHHLENSPEVRSYEVIHSDEHLLLVQFVIPISETYVALSASGIPPRYPTLLYDGWYSKEITASHERLAEYTEELDNADIPYQITSLTQSHDSNELLTERQWEFITEAIEQGFYDIPRDCTLTDLTERFNINISAMSRLRHRAESRIIQEFVEGSTPKSGQNRTPE
ncbi:helix-turn-helix domain-containing protein [Natrinema ejinorense]|uniref:Helix-turn-helix domain-containing protein n=1 Tax=Natrinema ejinorense TaxID=373386 RepID=A0A2A5QUN5_9EURY|nr:helix-turn-helix domain-containing protein [Natrinema ejinorense]PCR90493.1 helix-turn-helix domain-containing protein [Natrinema ejinorense]